MQPSFGGPLWSVLTIENDGDGGHGSRNYFDKILGKQIIPRTPPPTLNKKTTQQYPYFENIIHDQANVGHSVAMENGMMLVGVPNSDYIVWHSKHNKTVVNGTGMVIVYRQLSGVWSRMGELNPPLQMKKMYSAYSKFGASVDISIDFQNNHTVSKECKRVARGLQEDAAAP